MKSHISPHIGLLCWLLTFLIACTASPKTEVSALPQDPERQGWNSEALFPLYGNVKKVVVCRGEKITDVWFFNENGDVERRIGNPDSRYELCAEYRYDSLRNLVEECWFDASGELFSKQAYNYNPNRMLTSTLFYTTPEVAEIELVNLYDDSGRLVEQVSYSAYGSDSACVVRRHVYTYGTKEGYSTKSCAIYDDCGTLEEKESYTYDSVGNVIEYTEFDCDDLPVWTYAYTYDSSGNIVEEREYDADKALCTQTTHAYTYDENGRKIEKKTLLADGQPSVKTTFRYDAVGNQIEESILYYADSSAVTTTYRIEYLLDD